MATPRGIPSPCIGVCSLDEETGFCRGCFRSAAEVAGWPRGDDAWKEAVLKALEERKRAYHHKEPPHGASKNP